MNMQMRHERADGPTFDIANIAFIDFETRSPIDIKKAGATAYAVEASAIVLCYAIGNGPVRTLTSRPEAWAWQCGLGLAMIDLPTELLAFHAKVMNGRAHYAAWNVGFDKSIWNYSTDFPELKPEMIIDVMAQAVASGLPADLAGAARIAGNQQKLGTGKKLIELFCLPDAEGTPATHPREWLDFLDYARRDVDAMRSVFRGTRQLPLAEWREYWAMEAINERGVGIDMPFVARAAELAVIDRAQSSRELDWLTGGAVTSPDMVARLTAWLLPRLPAEQVAVLTSVEEQVDDDGEIKVAAKRTLRRRQVERLIAWAQDQPEMDDVLRVLQIRLYGGSKTPAKFGKMLAQQVDGSLFGQYVFNGAAQTGRACVDPDTLIDTPTGPRRVVDLAVGDLVIGGSHQPRKVLAKFYKGQEQMYALTGPRAAFVIATAAHRIMTAAGWRTIGDAFEKTLEGRFVLRGDCTPVSVRGMPHAGGSIPTEHDIRNGAQGAGDVDTAERVRSPEAGILLAQQDRHHEPDVRGENGSSTHHARRPNSGMEWQWLHDGASHSTIESTWYGDMAEGLGSTSHRRGQTEQFTRQPRTGDESWASKAAQAETWSLVPMGERAVWDISVERDESYVAQGLIHHNSSRGVQIHNLARDTIKMEWELLDDITRGCTYGQIASRGDDTPVSRKLSLLIRPAFVPRDNKVFVWSDWSQIEARILPWLADHLPGTKQRLEVFRAVDIDKRVPDIYTRTAADISHIAIDQVTKPIRQRGKVAELALGYCGGVGALQNMAAGYGMHLSDAEARQIVDRWREANPWAKQFADAIWSAVDFCRANPGVPRRVNRLLLVYAPDYLGGTLLIRLPSGRYLTYRGIRRTPVPVLDAAGKTIGATLELTFARNHNRLKLWPGMFVENVTQAAAADVLRGTLVRLEYEGFRTCINTHDECLVECEENAIAATATSLRAIMRKGFEWTQGLPLMSTETAGYYYSKDEDATWEV